MVSDDVLFFVCAVIEFIFLLLIFVIKLFMT
jgi:hypothetical protein